MNEKQTILIIEDERAISNFISRALNANDYRTIPAYTGKEGLSLFFSHGPDLVLLDLGLPDMDGLEILAQLRGLPREVPIIIISARDREAEKVRALDMGADDYVVKPFGVSEVLARIRSALRRAERLKLSQGIQRDSYQIKDLTIDLAKHQVLLAGRRSTLPKTNLKSSSCWPSMPVRCSPTTLFWNTSGDPTAAAAATRFCGSIWPTSAGN